MEFRDWIEKQNYVSRNEYPRLNRFLEHKDRECRGKRIDREIEREFGQDYQDIPE